MAAHPFHPTRLNDVGSCSITIWGILYAPSFRSSRLRPPPRRLFARDCCCFSCIPSYALWYLGFSSPDALPPPAADIAAARLAASRFGRLTGFCLAGCEVVREPYKRGRADRSALLLGALA